MSLHIKLLKCFFFCLIAVMSKSNALVQFIAPESNRCNGTEYFNPVTKNCTAFIGGGQAMFVDQNKKCRDDFVGVKPYPDTTKLYVICEPDVVVLANCPDNLRFNTKTLQCETIKKLPCDLTQMPECTKTGRFAVEQNSSCFYTCDDIGNKLISNLHQCPGTSLYSPTVNRCSYSCKTPPTQIFDSYDMDPTEKGFFPPCIKPGQFRTPTDCSKYYTCSSKTNGRFYQTRFKCPDATIYDLKAETCKPRTEVQCEMMSVVELLNLYEFYKERKRQCNLNYTDDASIEKCMKGCSEINISTTSLSTTTEDFSSTSEMNSSRTSEEILGSISEEISATTLKPIESSETSVTLSDLQTTASTEMPNVSTSSESGGDSIEESTMELLDESTSLKPKNVNTTTDSSEKIQNTTTVSSETETSTTGILETTSDFSSIASTTNDSNVLNTIDVSSTQEIIETTTKALLDTTTILPEPSVSEDLNVLTTTVADVLLNNETTPDDLPESTSALPVEIRSTPELSPTTESTTIATNISTTSENTENALISSTDDQDIFTSTVLTDGLADTTTQISQSENGGQSLSVEDVNVTTVVYNKDISSSILPPQAIPTEDKNVQSDSLIGLNSNETEPTLDNSTTEIVINSTEAVVATTENENTTKQSAMDGRLESTESTSAINSTPDIETSSAFAPNSTRDTMENLESTIANIESSTLNATENAQSTFETTLNTSEEPLTTSSNGNEEKNIENTTLLGVTTSEDDEISTTTVISSTSSDENETLGQTESTDSLNITNVSDSTGKSFNSTTTQVNDVQNTSEFTSSDDTTTDPNNTPVLSTETSNFPPESSTQTFIDTSTETKKLESESLISSDVITSTTFSSNSDEVVNTTADGIEIEGTTTEEIQQNFSNSTESENRTKNATLSTETKSTTENDVISTETTTSQSPSSTSDYDSVQGDSMGTLKQHDTELNSNDEGANNSTAISVFESENSTTISSTVTVTETPMSFNESTTPNTEPNTLPNETEAPSVRPPPSESLISSNEDEKVTNDTPTNDPFTSNETTSTEATTVPTAPSTTDNFTFQSTTVQNSSPLPQSNEFEYSSSTQQTDLVVESILGNNTENASISNTTESTSIASQTTTESLNSNTTTAFDQETTTLAAMTSTIEDLNSTFESTSTQALPETSTVTELNSNIDSTSQSSNLTTGNDENTPTTLLELITSTWWPSSTETKNESTEVTTSLSSESTSTELTSTESTSMKLYSTESISTINSSTESSSTTAIQNATDITTTPSSNDTQVVPNSNNNSFNNTYLDFEIQNVTGNEAPVISMHVKRNAVLNLNFTCC